MKNSMVNSKSMPRLLNEKLSIHYYDGGVFDDGGLTNNFDIRNVLVPTRDTFHCSDAGTRKNLVLKCSRKFTVTHIFIQAPRRRCTEPIANTLIWITDEEPNIEASRFYDDLSIEEVRAKSSNGLATVMGSSSSAPVLLTTDRESLEGEVSFYPYRSGKYIHLKFFDTYSESQENVDVAVVGVVGFFGTVATTASSTPPSSSTWWSKRQVVPPKQIHQHTLHSTFSARGWCCDGREFSGGCRGGHNDFNETTVYDVTFRCVTCGFDLCEFCVADLGITLGKVTRESAQFDLTALKKSATRPILGPTGIASDRRNSSQSSTTASFRRLAYNRIQAQLKVDPESALVRYLEGGILDVVGKVFNRDSISLLKLLIARLSPDDVVGRSAFAPDMFVSTTDLDLYVLVLQSAAVDQLSSMVQVKKWSDSFALGCVTATVPTSTLIPLSNSLERVRNVARLFQCCETRLLVPEWESLIGLADVTIPNGVGVFLAEAAEQAGLTPLVERLKTTTVSPLQEELLLQIEDPTSEDVLGREFSLTRDQWFASLCDRVRGGLLDAVLVSAEELTSATTLSSVEIPNQLEELLTVFVKTNRAANSSVEFLVYRLFSAGTATAALWGFRILNGLLSRGVETFFAKTHAWTQKILNLYPDNQDLKKAADGLIGYATVLRDEPVLTPPATVSSLCQSLLLLENFPVRKLFAATPAPKGFSQIGYPLTLKFVTGESTSLVPLTIEPLVPIQSVAEHYLLTHAIASIEYVRFCYELVGCVVEGLGLVVAFDIETDLDLGIHHVKQTDGGGVVKMILAPLLLEGIFVIDRKPNGFSDLQCRLTCERLRSGSRLLQEFARVRCQLDLLTTDGTTTFIEVTEEDNPLHALLPLLGLREAMGGYSSEGIDLNSLQLADKCLGESCFSKSSPIRQHSPRTTSEAVVVSVNPNFVHSVSLSVDIGEVPFELIWPMIRDEVVDTVRLFMSRSWGPSMTVARFEQMVNQAGSASGTVTIARGLSYTEATNVSQRIGHVVQSSVFEDPAGAEQAAGLSSSAAGTGRPADQYVLGQRIVHGGVPAVVVSVGERGVSLVEVGTKILHEHVEASPSSHAAPQSIRERLRDSLRRRILEMEMSNEELPILMETAGGGGHAATSLDQEDYDEMEHELDDDQDEMTNTETVQVDLPRIITVSDLFGGPGAPAGGWLSSISDLLVGVVSGGGDSSSGSPTVVRSDIPGIVRSSPGNPNLNGQISHRYSPADLEQIASNNLTEGTPSSFLMKAHLHPTVVFAGETSQSQLALPHTPFVAMIPGESIAKEYTVEFQFELCVDKRLSSLQSSGGSRIVKKRRTNDELSMEEGNCEFVGSPRASFACLREEGDNHVVELLNRLSLFLKEDDSSVVSDPYFGLLRSVIGRRINSQLDEALVLVANAMVEQCHTEDDLACNNCSAATCASLLPTWIRTISSWMPSLVTPSIREKVFRLTSLSPALTVHWLQMSKVGDLLSRRSQLQSDLNTVGEGGRRMQQISQELSNAEERIARNSWWFGGPKTCLAKLRKNTGSELLTMASALMQKTTCNDQDHISSSLLEIQFEGETGFGSAVTRSFFAEVAKELANNRLLWIQPDEGAMSCVSRRGLRLRPLMQETPPADDSIKSLCLLIGRLIGKAVAEGYIFPLPLSRELWAAIRDPSADRSLSGLPLPGDGTVGEFVGALANSKIRIENESDLAGSVFLETGFSGRELIPNGGNIPLTPSNVQRFIQLTTQLYLHEGIDLQIAHIRNGISDVFPVDSLLLFSVDELKEKVCGVDQIEWNANVLKQVLKFHEISSVMAEWLVEILLELNNSERSAFLDFVTSCPRMPAGGADSLRIEVFPEHIASSNLTSPVLRPTMSPPDNSPALGNRLSNESVSSGGEGSPMHVEPPLMEVVGYPRSRACVNHLYLPRYRSKETLKDRLVEAMVSSVHHDEITS